jgi:polar amino acid transport system substrate-binding protein
LRKSIGAFILAAAIGGAVAVVPKNGSAAAGSNSIGFTAAQAQAGQKLYSMDCATCHGDNLEGGAGPALAGPDYRTLSTKVKANVSDIFTFMAQNMPRNAPASLTHDQYVNLMAFILSKNGYHPGSAKLTYSQAWSSKAPIVKR